MADWTEGYAAQADYVIQYTPELNPVRAPLLFAQAGVKMPARIENACELGFGLGLSVGVHAAATPTQWWGTDFSPSQAAFARELAAGGGGRAKLVDEAFADFCHRSDLPDFDFVAMHGIWSWISEANRGHITDFLRRKLKPGGVLYVSYNTMPGWAQMVPVRHLMRMHAERMTPPGLGPDRQAEAARDFVVGLMAANSHLKEFYPLAANMIESLGNYAPAYLAHEYLNQDWEVVPFGEMARQLGGAKLGFACSAAPVQHFDQHFLAPDQQEYLRGIGDEVLREATRDFLVNRQFRKDYWVKGVQRLNPEQTAAAQRSQRVVLLRRPAEVGLDIREAGLNTRLPQPVRDDLLACLTPGQPVALGELEEQLAAKGYLFDTVRHAIIALVGNNVIAPVQSEEGIAASEHGAQAFNRHVFAAAMTSDLVSAVACPVTGGSIALPPHQLQMLHARSQGGKEPKDWARVVWEPLRRKGAGLEKNGQVLTTEADNLAYLTELATDFERNDLPLLKLLRCIE